MRFEKQPDGSLAGTPLWAGVGLPTSDTHHPHEWMDVVKQKMDEPQTVEGVTYTHMATQMCLCGMRRVRLTEN
jgi:hypothetical protein